MLLRQRAFARGEHHPGMLRGNGVCKNTCRAWIRLCGSAYVMIGYGPSSSHTLIYRQHHETPCARHKNQSQNCFTRSHATLVCWIVHKNPGNAIFRLSSACSTLIAAVRLLVTATNSISTTLQIFEGFCACCAGACFVFELFFKKKTQIDTAGCNMPPKSQARQETWINHL